MKKILMLCLLAGTMRAEMVRVESISPDPVRLQACIDRVKAQYKDVKIVPFEIDPSYVEAVKHYNPDATLIAVGGQLVGGQLVECYVRSSTGRYEPVSYSPEQSFWHMIRPKLDILARDNQKVAGNACLSIATTRIKKPNVDHVNYFWVSGYSTFMAGKTVGGSKVEEYDIVVDGASFFGPANPDLINVPFTCLFSPMMELKGFHSGAASTDSPLKYIQDPLHNAFDQ